MSTNSYRCPWCDATRTEPCVHVKSVTFGKGGLIKRIIFRDLADMPIETMKKYSLSELLKDGIPLAPEPRPAEHPPADYLLYPADFDERGNRRKGLGE